MARAPMTAVSGPAPPAPGSVDASGLGPEVPGGPPSPAAPVVMELALLHAPRATARLETAITLEDSILRVLIIDSGRYSRVKWARSGSSADERGWGVVGASTGVLNVGQAARTARTTSPGAAARGSAWRPGPAGPARPLGRG